MASREVQDVVEIDLLRYCELMKQGKHEEAQRELERIAASGEADFLGDRFRERLDEIAEAASGYYIDKSWAYGEIVKAAYSSSDKFQGGTFTFENEKGPCATTCVSLRDEDYF
jgi:hypothetical protein